MPDLPRPPLPAPTDPVGPTHVGAGSSDAAPAPAPAVDRSAVVADLVLAVLEAGRVTRALGEAVNKATGIHRSNYLTLLRVQEHDRSRISDIAAGLELDVSVISRKVAALDELGLVSREQDPADGRAQVVSVTDHGREVIALNRRIYTDAVERLTAEWDTADLAALAVGLHRLGTQQLPDVSADASIEVGR